ncbi:tannase/feruloyl esterase family alpha/beta hydrolase [Pseudoroseicyclus tamaricis]|uniref:Tannase/feruloyl esterase family alpha/beta hydrolase n=1 Tax=Pseudoroseicyclus tamaricis TaxID=2705421 RepID=A0A6B2K047_9RHOB|nr:tannase/feruloyl esterase family alpha/beta hydrolase [Pseudoroseicyclus tamaricis]NDV01824.1 tannase/feruloyl esterase family alpha/beta hydrolase [Pseudoroseicyclus tamaricis]
MRHHLIAGAAIGLASAAPAMAQDCAGLQDMGLGAGTVSAAAAVEAGALQIPGRDGVQTLADAPALCRIEARLSSEEGSDIGMELWLPEPEAWNGRFVVVGNGGFAGSISHGAMAGPLAAGYAVASTDTGHEGGADASFALEEPAFFDFAYRAVHETAAASKEVIGSYYEGELEESYFTGCSTGGRQALTAAARYPEDFDGIVAGAAAVNGARLHAQQVFTGLVGMDGGQSVLTDEDYAAIAQSTLDACDMNDGVADGVIENPLACEPDLAAAGLSGEKLETAEALYTGPLDASGAPLFHGYAPGSEGTWFALRGEAPLIVASDFFRIFVHGDESWSWEGFDPEAEIANATSIADTIGAESADLSEFFSAGGKLIMYHGWADPGISPYNSIAFYEDIRAESSGAEEAARLFMVPGMGHCGGGPGPTSFDMLSAIDGWVTEGAAPEVIPAAHLTEGVADRTRILCPFPQVATYSGEGDNSDAANFSCQMPGE